MFHTLRICIAVSLATAATAGAQEATEAKSGSGVVVVEGGTVQANTARGEKERRDSFVWSSADNRIRDGFTRWAGGTAEGKKPGPVYTHPFAFRLVVLQGTAVLDLDGDARELAAGGYAALPANVKHRLSCKAGADCLFFIVYTNP
jgi:mannose-6-phosphate isomerase-like protein (cupin superfamily)